MKQSICFFSLFVMALLPLGWRNAIASTKPHTLADPKLTKTRRPILWALKKAGASLTRGLYACFTATKEATTPALPAPCGMVRITVPTMAGTWFTPSAQSGTT